MNKNKKIYLGIMATRQSTKTVVQYTSGPIYCPQTDEDWNNLQKMMTNKFDQEFGRGWSFSVYELPRQIAEQYDQETKELFDAVLDNSGR